MADQFIGDLTLYPVIAAAGVDSDDTWVILVDGVLRQITTTEMLNLFQTAGGYQPLDSDLTAIAALTTSAYGRSLLTLADASALAAQVDSVFLTPAEGDAAYQPLDAGLTQIAALADPDVGTGTSVPVNPLLYWNNATGSYDFLELGSEFVVAAGMVKLYPFLASANTWSAKQTFDGAATDEIITVGGLTSGDVAILVNIADVQTVLEGRFASAPTQYGCVDVELVAGSPTISLNATHPTLGDSSFQVSADGHFFSGPGDVWIDNTRVRQVATPIAGTDAVNKTYVDGGFQPLNANLTRLAAMTDPGLGTGTGISENSIVYWDNVNSQFGYADLSSQFVISSTGVISVNVSATITGTDTHVLFFDGANNPAGDSGLTFNKTTNSLTVTGNHFVGSGTMSVGTNGVGVLVVGNSAAPTTYPADEAQAWCADISADNAALHVAGEGLVAAVMVGGLTVRQKAGVAGTDELRITDDGTHSNIRSGNSSLRVLHDDGNQIVRFADSAYTTFFGPSGVEISGQLGHVTVLSGSDVRASGFAAFTVTNPTLRWSSGSPNASLVHNATGVMRFGDGSTGICAVLMSRLVEANTAGSGSPNVLLPAESRTVLTNEGATAENYHTLPNAAAGLDFTFIVQDSDGIRITAASGDTIRPIAGTAASATGGFIRCATLGAFIRLLAINATEWVAIGSAGTWTIDV